MVFTVPPRNVAFKICDELVHGSEGVRSLLASEVTVITLADLVVVAQHTHAVYHVRQPILKLVR